jgi:predicted Zn-dependent protease
MFNQSRVAGYKLGQEGGDLKNAKKYGAAEKKLKEALSHWPSDTYANAFLGEVYHHTNRRKEATKHFKAALEASGKFPDPYWFLGTYSLDDKKFEEAAFNFKKVTAANPKDQDSWMYLAQSYRWLNKLPDALKAIKTHLKMFPRDGEALELKKELTALKRGA